MASTLDLKIEGFPDPEADPKGAAVQTAKPGYNSYKVFLILRDFLQPDTTTSLKFAVDVIDGILPENAPLSDDVWQFGTVCFELAEQIPYHHPSQQKLARLLEHLGLSVKVNAISSKDKTRFHNRYQLLGEHMRDELMKPDDETPEEYVNYHAFIANLYQCHVFHADPTYAIWALRDALETSLEDETQSVRNALVLGAAQWILWNGHGLLAQIQFLGDVSSNDMRAWKAGRLYSGEPLLTLHRWRFWRDGFRGIADGEMYAGSSDECKMVAGRAADMMCAFEKNMLF